MADLTRRLTAILTLFLFASSLGFAKGPYQRPYNTSINHDAPMPQEVLSAKTVALVLKMVGESESDTADYKQRTEADVTAEIQKQSRFQLVSDPDKADLVFMLIAFYYPSWHAAYHGGEGFWGRSDGRRNLMPPGIIVVFKGGNDPHRTARPVWMKTSYMGAAAPVRLMKAFHSAFAKAEKKHGSQAKHRETPEEKPDQGMIAGPAPMPQMGDAGKNSPVLCGWGQPCRIPREISAARKVMVCDPLHSCNDVYMQQDVIWGARGRWELVDDPAKADLMIILCWTPSRSSESRIFVYAGMYIFKGGEQPDWNSMPMYMQFGHDHDSLLRDLENMVAQTGLPFLFWKPGDAQKTGKTKPYH